MKISYQEWKSQLFQTRSFNFFYGNFIIVQNEAGENWIKLNWKISNKFYDFNLMTKIPMIFSFKLRNGSFIARSCKGWFYQRLIALGFKCTYYAKKRLLWSNLVSVSNITNLIHAILTCVLPSEFYCRSISYAYQMHCELVINIIHLIPSLQCLLTINCRARCYTGDPPFHGNCISLSSALYLILAILCFIILFWIYKWYSVYQNDLNMQSLANTEVPKQLPFQYIRISWIFIVPTPFCNKRPWFSGLNEILGQYCNSKVSSNDSLHLSQLF